MEGKGRERGGWRGRGERERERERILVNEDESGELEKAVLKSRRGEGQ